MSHSVAMHTHRRPLTALLLTLLAALAVTTAASSRPAQAQIAEARVPLDTATVGAQLTFEHVQGIDPWVMLSAHRKFVPSWGSALTRLTVGERFGSVGVQGEAEMYPKIGRVGYMYAAAAISPHEDVFVPFRAALELFTSPAPGLELSAGARLFRVASNSVVVYTGSVGGYRGNYWAAFRPYFGRRNGVTSTTGQFSLRRYWAGRHDYVGAYVSGTRGADPTADDPARIGRAPDLTSFSGRVERVRPARDGRLRLGYGLGVETEEVSPSNRRTHLVATFRIERLLQ